VARRRAESRPSTEKPSSAKGRNLRRQRPWWKKLLFAGLSFALFFGLLEVGLIALGVRPLAFTDDPHVGFASYAPLFVKGEAADGNAVMRTAKTKQDWFNDQQFLVEKPGNTFRIFSLGGSTTYGRPYDDRTSFNGWLREYLSAVESSRRWEVINAGGISYASYRVARVMEELNEHEPDLYIIYCGHNEFLERRTYSSIIETPEELRNISSFLGRTRTYSVLWRMIHTRQQNDKRKGKDGERTELSAEVKPILENAIGPDAYTRDRKLRRQIIAHYRFNLYRMVRMARSAGAEVILVVPASNLRHCSPFKSEHRAELDEKDRVRFSELLRGAQQAFDQQRLAAALRMADAALAIDGEYAHLSYLRGQILWAMGRHDEAASAFVRARENDVCPLRAVSEMAEIVREVAEKLDVPLVDFEELIAEESEQGVPGERWFLDHVHPTIAGHRLLAEQILERMREAGFLDADSRLRDETKQTVIRRVESRIDQRAHAAALKNLSKVLGWAGKHDDAQRLALRAVAMIPDDPEAQYQAGNAYIQRREYDRAITCFTNSLKIRPNSAQAYYGIGVCYERKRDAEKAIAHYLRAIQKDADFANAHYNLAGLFAATKRLDKAAHHYREALRINPDDFLSHNNLGVLAARRNDLDAARKYFKAAVKAKPTYAAAHANLGFLQLQRGDTRGALGSFRTALRHQPSHVNAALKLAEILATSPVGSLRDGKTALFWAKRLARQTRHRRADVLAVLAAAYAETGDFVSAVKWQQTAIEGLPPSQKQAHQSRLQLYRAGKPYRAATLR